MKPLPLALPLAVALAFGCARIYRPVALAMPPATASTDGLAGALVLQPWGDNSRYEAKARRAGLRVAVLVLENRSASDLVILGLEAPDNVSILSPETAAGIVKQHAVAYLLYPLVPGMLIPGSATKGSYGPSDQAMFSALAIVGACIGVPNALVAARSNRRLEAFLRDSAWAPGTLRPGQVVRGLVFIRSRDPYAPLLLRLRSRGGTGERALALVCPGVSPS